LYVLLARLELRLTDGDLVLSALERLARCQTVFRKLLLSLERLLRQFQSRPRLVHSHR